MATTIRNPIEWGFSQMQHVVTAVEVTGQAVRGHTDVSAAPAIRHIDIADLREALAQGLADFGAARSDVIFLCLIYPIAGLVLGHAVFGSGMFPMLFPLVSGFALIAPFIAVGLYEMSRQRAEGHEADWKTAFDVLHAPSFGAILTLGIALLAIFLLWLGAAQVIYDMTLGPREPASVAHFLHDVFATPQGRSMIVIGVGVGFLFAVFAFAISVVSFPLLLDRDVGLGIAVSTSVRAVIANPLPMAVWGAIIAAGMIVGSLPLLLGLIVILPVLGHASWHLYRKLVV